MLNPETAAKHVKASRSKSWTEDEELKLREHISSKKGIKMIKKMMKMSTCVLRQKCVELQLKVWNETKKCWQIQIEENKFIRTKTKPCV